MTKDDWEHRRNQEADEALKSQIEAFNGSLNGGGMSFGDAVFRAGFSLKMQPQGEHSEHREIASKTLSELSERATANSFSDALWVGGQRVLVAPRELRKRLRSSQLSTALAAQIPLATCTNNPISTAHIREGVMPYQTQAQSRT